MNMRPTRNIEVLQKAQHFTAAVIDMAGALVIVLDRHGQVIQFNRACEEISGYTFEEAKGKYIWDLFLIPEEVLPIKEIFANIHKGSFPNRHENQWTVKDGTRRLIAWSDTAMTDEKGNVEYGIWVGLDITYRKKIEEELRSSEERYRALIENVKDGVALIQEQTLIFANDAFLSMFGYETPQDLMGQNLTDLVDPEFKEKFTTFLTTALSEKSWGLPFRGKFLTKTGQEFWAEKRSSLITYKGEPAILVTARDITENMLWEQTIKQEAEYFRNENVKLKSTIGERYRLGNIVGKSRAMQKIYELILKAGSCDANVIIFGKSGTGKELVARAVHDMSDRSDKPFIPVHCAAIPENLIESEFFGHKKGAFTGAHMDKHGYIKAADSGSLFLDEIGDIPLNMQVKLLRAIESGEYTPVGSSKAQQADIRIIAALNKDPLEMVNNGMMREDFFYRISVIHITLPELKERKEDIPLLTDHLLRSYTHGEDPRTIPPDIMNALMNYDWPGNVRELQNVLQRYLTVKTLDFMNISAENGAGGISDDETGQEELGLETRLEEFEKKVILKTLEKFRWNRTKAAASLGISRRSLFRRMKKLGI